MKKTLVGFTLLCTVGLSSHAFGAQSQHPCDYPIMHAFTKEDAQEVWVCASGDNISYTFGKVADKHPAIDILIPKSSSEFYSYEHGEEASLATRHDRYTISNLTDETGQPIREIVIHKDGEKLTTIKLDTFEYSRITYGNLGDFDIGVETNQVN